MAVKNLALSRDDECTVCGVDLSAGTRAQWDSSARTVTCLLCVAGEIATRFEAGEPVAPAKHPVEPPGSAADPPVEPSPPEIDTGQPGASARREHERRQAKREREIEQTWGGGRIGKIAKWLSDDPQSTKAWEKGAEGEELVAQILHDRLGDEAILLHDRKVPKSRGNIDHLVIARSGVWIIDAKRYKGKVERRDVGKLFRSDVRLYVGGRDRSKTLGGLSWQLDAVRAALGSEEAPVHCALSFVGAEWPLLFAKPFEMDGVWVSWTTKLADLIDSDGPMSPDDINRIAHILAAELPSK